MTARLLPGVTTVTTNCRYYAIHGLVADEAARRSLSLEDTIDLSRRCEVVFALAAQRLQPSLASSPHGIGRLEDLTDFEGPYDLAALSTPKTGYSDTAGGFRGPYIGSEITLGVRDRHSIEMPGPRFDASAARGGLAGLLEAADQDVISGDHVKQLTNLTLDPNNANDGPWLRDLLFTPDSSGDSFYREADSARRNTAALLVEATRAVPARSFNDSFVQFVAYQLPDGHSDHASAWRGTLLRWYSVGAWRRLWSWLVAQIDGYMPISEVADAVVDALGEEDSGRTVSEWMRELPTLTDGQALWPAEEEITADMEGPAGYLAVLLLGGQRSTQLTGRARDALVGRASVLGPEWVRARTEDWGDRSLGEFARFIVAEMFRRSHRIAQKKAHLDHETGRVVVPTRVHVDGDLVWKDSLENPGDVGLRVNQLGGMMSALGLFDVVDDMWAPTALASDLFD